MSQDALQPYRGVRVLDLAQGLAGPYAAGMLAAMGADVVKVEPPEGDWGRLMGATRNGHSSMGLPANWGKRAVCIDARSDTGKGVLARLAADAGVVIESFRPGVLSRLGLGYEQLRQMHAGTILASISGYGQEGPYASRPGTDTILQAVSGMANMNADSQGRPRKIGMLAADMITGMYAGYAIGAALFEQRSQGAGRHIQISLMEAAAAFQTTAMLQGLLSATPRGGPATAPSGFFPTRTGMIAVACLRHNMFVTLCEVVNRPAWPDDPRFCDHAARLENVDVLHAELADILAERDGEDWIERLNAAGVLCGPVNDYADLVEDTQARHMSLFTEVDTAAFGPVPLVGLPGSGNTPDRQRPAPGLGEHTREILAQAGYAQAEVDRLVRDGVCKDFSSSGVSA